MPADPEFEELLETHQSSLLHYAGSLTGDAAQAQDVVQETFLRLLRLPRERWQGPIRAWLFRVARNLAIDGIRRRAKVVSLDPNALPEAVCEDSPFAEDDRLDAVLLLLRDLPARQREAIRLKFSAGLSYREIGEVIGVSESNAGYLLHLALKTIRERLPSSTQATP